MRRFWIGLVMLGFALGWLPTGWLGPEGQIHGALAQRSGGGVGGRGGFSTPRSSPSIPRVNPSPAPSFPVPTPRTYPTYPTYPRDYYPYPSRPIVVGPGVGFAGGEVVILLVVVGLAVISISMVRGLSQAGGGLGGSTPDSEVARLRIATLYSREVQQSLRHLAESADTNTTKGLADLVDEAVVVLLRDQSGWRFGSYESSKGSLERSESQFDLWMTQARAEYVETYRNFEGKITTNTSYVPKAEPDGRYLLVTFVVAAHGGLGAVPLPLRAEGARQALINLSGTTSVTLLAAYLSWTPEASGEALTEEDLLTGWPGLEML